MVLPLNGHLSSYYSDVPQGLVLGQVFFIICITDVDIVLNILISKLADDIKISILVLTDKDKQSLEGDLLTISTWSERWEMLLNIDKCQVLQVGTKNKYDPKGVQHETQVFSLSKT